MQVTKIYVTSTSNTVPHFVFYVKKKTFLCVSTRAFNFSSRNGGQHPGASRPLTAVNYYCILQHLVTNQIHAHVDCCASTHNKFKNAQVPVGQCLTNQSSQNLTSILSFISSRIQHSKQSTKEHMLSESMKRQHPQQIPITKVLE